MVVTTESSSGSLANPPNQDENRAQLNFENSGNLDSSLTAEKQTQNNQPRQEEFVHEYVDSITVVIILIPTTLVYFLLMLDGSIISVAIPDITSQFNSLLDIGW